MFFIWMVNCSKLKSLFSVFGLMFLLFWKIFQNEVSFFFENSSLKADFIISTLMLGRESHFTEKLVLLKLMLYPVSWPYLTIKGCVLTHVMPCLFLYHLKTSENYRFYDFFRGYRKRSVAWSWLICGTCYTKIIVADVKKWWL